MSEKQYKSLFDIIGPVMIGPSSSHTAGAVRIGNMVRSIFGDKPESVNIYLYESFAQTYKGHGTNLALLGGLMGLEPDDDRIQDAFLIANEQEISYRFIPLTDKAKHPNTARFVLRKGNRKMTITGESIGGGNAHITQIDDFNVLIRDGINTIVTTHQDVPGVIAGVSSILSKLDINVASMKVWRTKRGQEASMVIEVDAVSKDFDAHELYSCEAISHVMYVGGAYNGND